MRRWFAWALLLLTALWPLQPLLVSAQIGVGLPACCRRDGVHHCKALQAIADGESHPVVRSSPCPLWKLPANPALIAAPGASLTLPVQPAKTDYVVAIAPAFLFDCPARSRSARAPPSAPLSVPSRMA